MKKYLSLFIWMVLVSGFADISAQTASHGPKTHLQKIAEEQSLQSKRERAEAEAIANKMGIPIKISYPDGSVVELQKFENGVPKYYRTNNLNSAYTTSTVKIWPGGISGLSLTGKNVLLGIWDGGGTRLTHREFSGRAEQKDIPAEISDHATHVAGTMIAEGLDPLAHGMSPDANLYAYDWNDDESEMILAAENGLLISNHSYGYITGWHSETNELGKDEWYWYGVSSISNVEDYCFGFYSLYSALWDTIAYNAPYYLIVKSAGNDRTEGPSSQPVNHWEFVDTNKVWVNTVHPKDGRTSGYDCLPESSTPKNVLTVGAVWDILSGYSSPEDVLMMTFNDWGSSWGPTDDGRIKPDIVANGTGLYSSLAATDNSYDYYSGTSMAAPSVSGSVGLLLEHQENLHPGVKLLSSTMKGILIHTADEAGPNPGPDYMFGWGLMNTYKAAQFMSKNVEDDQRYIILEYPINTGETFELPIECYQTEFIKATICWNDPPGISPAPSVDPDDIMLVNDLDLRIDYPAKTMYYPWRLDPHNPDAAATTGDNFIDNVEQIFIENPEDGHYIVRVTPKGNILNGPQIVSIIISAPKQRVSLASPGYDYNQILTSPFLQWNKFQGATKYGVQVSSTSNFQTIEFEQNNITNNYIAAGGLQPNTVYYWRVKYGNSSGYGDWSDVWKFTTAAEPGEAGNAIRFDGVDDYIEVPPHSKFDPIENEDKLTIETWIYINNFYGDLFPITDFRIVDSDWGWSLLIYQPEGLELNLLYSSQKASYAFEPDKWYHIAVSCDKSENKIRFFVNGTKIHEGAFEDDIPDTHQFGTPLLIGANLSGGDEYANGIIDELRIWSIARTEQQIKDNMFLPVTGNPVGLVANFDFNGGTGLTVDDVSGNVYDGSFKGNPTWLVSNAPFGLPGIPELLNPQNDDDNVSVNPEFKWLSVTSAEYYWLQVSTDADFSNIIFDDQTLSGLSATVNNLQYETKYYWRVCAKNIHGSGGWSTIRSFTTEILVGVAVEQSLPEEFSLSQNYPNPFNPTTTIKFSIPAAEKIFKTSLRVYDVLGKEVAMLVDEVKEPGFYVIEFNGSHLASGMYICRLTAGEYTSAKKMLLIK